MQLLGKLGLVWALLLIVSVGTIDQASAREQAPTKSQATSGAEAKDQAYQPRTRDYYVAAENVPWDYAPTGKNLVHPNQGLGPWGEQTVYDKTRFVEYTDQSFTKKKPQPKWLGILGPVIRGVVGDTIKIHFKNNTDRPCSIHPLGTQYDKDDEGAAYADKNYPGQSVAPANTYTYTLHLTPEVGPGPNDPSSILRLYRSHVQPVKDMYRGLMGPIIITDAEHGTASGKPSNIDRSFVTMFLIFDENADGQEIEGDLMHSINGYIWGNQPGLEMNLGDKVRWYVFGMGSEADNHTPHWHGNGVTENGHRREVLSVLPTTTHTVDMHANNPGTWLFKCNIGDHVEAGMMSLYHVNRGKGPGAEGKTLGGTKNAGHGH